MEKHFVHHHSLNHLVDSYLEYETYRDHKTREHDRARMKDYSSAQLSFQTESANPLIGTICHDDDDEQLQSLAEEVVLQIKIWLKRYRH